MQTPPEMLDSVTTHWLTQAEGWRTLDDRIQYPFADLVAVNESGEGAVDESGEVVLIVCAYGGDMQVGVCCALGRLILMMDRDFEVNAFGLPIPDPSLNPPLIRYVLAVPAGADWLRLARAIPQRVRKMLHLIVLRVSKDEVVKYLPGVAI